MKVEPREELLSVEDEDSSDDIYVSLNISALIEKLISIEDMARESRREEANRLFLEALKSEVFDGE